MSSLVSPSLDDLVLMDEVSARRALAPQPLAFTVLAPVGSFAGRGTLRVLRAQPRENGVELVCGYESYVALEPRERGVRA